MQQQEHLWWQKEVIYQIYPRSFQDSNSDGVGDLQGIISRLDYLQWLGIKVVWISPIYPSPMADFGYDISDYQDIHPLFGGIRDFDQLLAEIHKRGMKLILDLVPNHTSDQHPWFIESRSSKDNPKRNWYIWENGRQDGNLPNNWLAQFGGPAWEWDELTGQYYYHAFLKEQPDLNWRNPDVQNAMFNMMRFWLDKGVDGFRVDVMWHMIKHADLIDNPINPDYKPHMATCEQVLHVFNTDQPEVHDIVHKMRRVLDEYDDRMMIGEIYLPIHKLVAYYGYDSKGAHLPFNFQLLTLPWNAIAISNAISEYEGALPQKAWPNWVLGNHDQPRITSRVGLDQAKVAAMLLLTLRGTPTIYYGDEIGMRDVPIPFAEIQDPQGLNMPDKNLSRDPSRTPMQWSGNPNAGFSIAKPWLRIDKNYKVVNVETQKKDKTSCLNYYRKLIQLRQSEPALRNGDYRPLYADNQMIAFTRKWEGDNFLVLLNLSHRPCYYKPSYEMLSGIIMASTSMELEGQKISGNIELSGDEGIVVKIES